MALAINIILLYAKAYSTWYSQAVSHPSTNQAQKAERKKHKRVFQVKLASFTVFNDSLKTGKNDIVYI